MIVIADSSAVVKFYADEQVAAFEADYHGSVQDQPRFGVLAVTASVLETAARLVGVHGLRAEERVVCEIDLAKVPDGQASFEGGVGDSFSGQ